jgi:hypothetical protein
VVLVALVALAVPVILDSPAVNARSVIPAFAKSCAQSCRMLPGVLAAVAAAVADCQSFQSYHSK